jgi:hypothetical protein
VVSSGVLVELQLANRARSTKSSSSSPVSDCGARRVLIRSLAC